MHKIGFFLSYLRLEITTLKCSLFVININPTSVESLAVSIHCKVGTLPFSYLGLVVGADINDKSIQELVAVYKNFGNTCFSMEG